MKTVILFVAVAFAACNSLHSVNRPANTASKPTPAKVVQTGEDVRRITTTELAELMKQGNVVVVDVRSKADYDRGHIRGAKLLPLHEVGDRAKELPHDKQIVTYCA